MALRAEVLAHLRNHREASATEEEGVRGMNSGERRGLEIEGGTGHAALYKNVSFYSGGTRGYRIF